MNFYKKSYQLILRYHYTETIKRRGEISLHRHFIIAYYLNSYYCLLLKTGALVKKMYSLLSLLLHTLRNTLWAVPVPRSI